MDKRQKQIAAAAAGLLVLMLIYRWRQSQNAASATPASATPAPDTSASDYASLAGQEQGDVASLQQQNQSLLASFQGLGAQEQSDVAGLTASIAGVGASVSGLEGAYPGLAAEVPLIAAGLQQVNRQVAQQGKTKMVPTKGSFTAYYKQVTGKNAPASIASDNWVLQAFRNGVKASALATPANHAGRKNTHVAHPNAAHTPQSGKNLPRSTTTHAKPTTHASGVTRTGPVRTRPTAPSSTARRNVRTRPAPPKRKK